jgi:phosphate/sulfate permease
MDTSVLGLLGMSIAMLTVIGNDCVQTLSTFIQSCGSRKASVIWMSLFLSIVFVGTLCYGYFVIGDIAFGRLEEIPYQEPQFFHLIPLFALFILTFYGVPVSTTFIVLSVFSSNSVMLKMVEKSVIGGAVSFGFAFLVWYVLVRFFDERKDFIPQKYIKLLIGFQSIATALLLIVWIMHDFANILVFVPRGQDIPLSLFILICIIACLVLTFIVYTSGGKIQKVVATKIGTNYVFSAILIDLAYAFVLFVLKEYSNIPMSTTWAFIGLILGREFAMAIYHEKTVKNFLPIAKKDTFRLVIGAVISVLVVEFVKIWGLN